MFATGRNAIVVLLCAGIAAILLNYGIEALTLTKNVHGGLPNFTLPKFSYSYQTHNETHTEGVVEILSEIGSGMVIIPLLSILEAIAIAKAFAKGKKLDATQELIALGICNFMGSFVSAYPTTGSFSRTAINNSSGVRTTLSGVFTGAIVLLALGVLAPYFVYLPSSSLAAIIFVSVIFMVHYQDVPLIWRTKKWDLVPLFATFIGSFIFGLEYGILIGVGLSFVFLLFQEARPTVEITLRTTMDGVTYLFVCPDRSIFFPSVEYLKAKINKGLPDDVNDFCVLFDGSKITTADYTMALGLKNMIDGYKKDNIITIFLYLQDNVQESLRGTQPVVFNSCHSLEDAHLLINQIARKAALVSNGALKLEPSSNEDPVDGMTSVAIQNDVTAEPTSNGTALNGSVPASASHWTSNCTTNGSTTSNVTASPLLQENVAKDDTQSERI